MAAGAWGTTRTILIALGFTLGMVLVNPISKPAFQQPLMQVALLAMIEGYAPSYGGYSDIIGGVGSGSGSPATTTRTWGHDSVGAVAPAADWSNSLRWLASVMEVEFAELRAAITRTAAEQTVRRGGDVLQHERVVLCDISGNRRDRLGVRHGGLRYGLVRRVKECRRIRSGRVEMNAKPVPENARLENRANHQ